MTRCLSSQSLVHQQQVRLDFDSQGNGLRFTRIQVLAQRVRQLPVRHNTPINPGGFSNFAAPRLALSLLDDFMPHRFRKQYAAKKS
jgi:hypothetical protein